MITQGPIRVPVIDPEGQPTGKWLYLRAWNRWGALADRSYANSVNIVTAYKRDSNLHIHVEVAGLPGLHQTIEGSGVADGMRIIDQYLLETLGGERVPPGEWPEGCVGNGAPESHPPFDVYQYVKRLETLAEQRAEYSKWQAMAKRKGRGAV